MRIKIIKENFSVCKVKDYSQVNLNAKFCFAAKTDEENSLCVLQKMFRTMCWNEKMGGEHSAFRESWIFR